MSRLKLTQLVPGEFYMEHINPAIGCRDEPCTRHFDKCIVLCYAPASIGAVAPTQYVEEWSDGDEGCHLEGKQDEYFAEFTELGESPDQIEEL
jgi:hypothetical protein